MKKSGSLSRPKGSVRPAMNEVAYYCQGCKKLITDAVIWIGPLPFCRGCAKEQDDRRLTCPECDGEGVIVGEYGQEIECWRCNDV